MDAARSEPYAAERLASSEEQVPSAVEKMQQKERRVALLKKEDNPDGG